MRFQRWWTVFLALVLLNLVHPHLPLTTAADVVQRQEKEGTPREPASTDDHHKLTNALVKETIKIVGGGGGGGRGGGGGFGGGRGGGGGGGGRGGGGGGAGSRGGGGGGRGGGGGGGGSRGGSRGGGSRGGGGGGGRSGGRGTGGGVPRIPFHTGGGSYGTHHNGTDRGIHDCICLALLCSVLLVLCVDFLLL